MFLICSYLNLVRLKVKFKKLFLVLLSGLSFLAPIANSQSVPNEVKIGYQKGIPLLLLVKKQEVIEHRLKKLGVENVKWVEFQFGPPMLEALGAGAIDIGAVGDTPPIFAQAAGSNIAYVAAIPSVEHAVLVPKDSPIKTLADLKGKRVAVAKASSAHNVLIKALAIAGLTLKDIEPVYLAPADATAAFNGGKVDAWVVWDPYYAIAQDHYNARVITDTTDKRLVSAGYYLAHRNFANNQPKVLDAILSEIKTVTIWGSKHREEVAKIAADATGIDHRSWLKSFARTNFDLTPVKPVNVTQQQQLANIFYSLGIIPKEIKVSDIVWNWVPQK